MASSRMLTHRSACAVLCLGVLLYTGYKLALSTQSGYQAYNQKPVESQDIGDQPFAPPYSELEYQLPAYLPEPLRPPPWLQPYLINPNYVGLHNDLKALLASVQRDKWITIFDYTMGQRDFFLNCLYSYLKFGEANFFIVATVTRESMEDCLAMQLPCYNATNQYLWTVQRLNESAVALMESDTQRAFHNFHSAMHIQLTWMKIKLIYEVLNLGYNAHTTHLDVAYMRKILPSFSNIVEKYDADASFLAQNDGGSDHWLNPECAFIRSNERTVNLYENFVSLIKPRSPDCEWVLNQLLDEQAGPGTTARMKICSTKQTCSALKANAIVAVVKTPSLFGEGRSCLQDRFKTGACDSRRLYVHTLCGVGRPWKVWALRSLGLWFLKDHSGNDIDVLAGQHSKLPCPAPDDVAWHKDLQKYYP